MPSGYEKSSDYGGPEPSRRVLTLVSGIAVVCVLVFVLWPSQTPPKIVDGDTFDLGAWRIRPWGVDSPENNNRQCSRSGLEWDTYEAAKTGLSELIVDRPVSCSIRHLEWKLQWPPRWVADCSVDGRDIAAAMVEAGWACDYKKYSKGHFAALEAGARAAKRGLWQCDDPPPWKCKP